MKFVLESDYADNLIKVAHFDLFSFVSFLLQ